jgi:hypothetical protein
MNKKCDVNDKSFLLNVLATVTGYGSLYLLEQIAPMITNGEGTMNWNCEVCGTDFIVPTNAMNTLMIAATHCVTCTKELSARFSAIVGA